MNESILERLSALEKKVDVINNLLADGIFEDFINSHGALGERSLSDSRFLLKKTWHAVKNSLNGIVDVKFESINPKALSKKLKTRSSFALLDDLTSYNGISPVVEYASIISDEVAFEMVIDFYHRLIKESLVSEFDSTETLLSQLKGFTTILTSPEIAIKIKECEGYVPAQQNDSSGEWGRINGVRVVVNPFVMRNVALGVKKVAAELTWDKILALTPVNPPAEDFLANPSFMTKFQFEITDKTQYKTFVWKDMLKNVKKED